MFVVPLGVEAKTRDFPLATLTIVVLVFFYSVMNMRVSTNFLEAYMELPERRAYQVELKAYLVGECPKYVDKYACQIFNKEIQPEQLSDAGYVRRLLENRTTGPREKPLTGSQLDQLETLVKPWTKERDILRMNEPGPAFEKLKASLIASENATRDLLKKHKLFSSKNFDPIALMRAQFLHADWMHLIGNMVFLLLLALPVEQRLGLGTFVGVYLLSGTAGIMSHALFPSQGLYILGASANVFGIAGAFVALFFKQRMRLWVSFFFVSNRVVMIPVLLYFAAWIVAEEVLGVASIDGSNVAHSAHLVGLFVGFLCAAAYQKFYPLAPGIIYPYEAIIQIKAQRTLKPLRLFQTYKDWMRMNPSSPQAATGLLVSGAMLMKENPKDQGMAEFLKHEWPEILERNLQHKEFVDKVPLDWLKGDGLKIDPGMLRKSMAKFVETDERRAEWILLVHVLWGMEERGFPELEERLRKLSESVLQEPDFIESIQNSALRNEGLAQFLEKMGLWLAIRKDSYAG